MRRAFPSRHQLSRISKNKRFILHRPFISLPRRNYSTTPTPIPASTLQFGQPLHETHPHLLKAGELTPGITALEYSQRRSRLASLLPRNGIAVLAAAELQYRSGSVFYEFHQDSNFYYLTGFNEPEAVAVIGRGETEGDHELHLFVREKDPKAEQWEGSRSGTQAAVDVFNADESGDIRLISRLLSPLISGASKIYTDILASPPTSSVLSRFFAQISPRDDDDNDNTSSSTHSHTFSSLLSKSSTPVKPLKPLLNSLRSIKSPAEIDVLRHVGRMSGRAFTNAMRHRFTNERSLATYLEHDFRLQGCDTSAYIPVVASGHHANTIHYVANNAIIPPNNDTVVLVDAGGSYGGYIADITRTWPAGNPSGKFSPAHRDLYAALLGVQRTCISLCRANAHTSLDDLHSTAESLLRDALSQLGFPTDRAAMDTLFPHHVGHYIGLDVHDTPGLSRREALQEGQCVTVEPGVYVPEQGDQWPERFRGVGMRVEDSVCVGAEGPVVLTAEAVKEVEDIEALRGGA